MVLGVCIKESICIHHGAMADSSRGTYAFRLAELLSVSAVVGLSVTVVLCASGYVGLILF